MSLTFSNWTLRGFRDYDEKNVINLFTFSGQTSVNQVVSKGALVAAIPSAGWRNDQDPSNIIGTYGDFSINNVQALRYGNTAQVTYFGTGTIAGNGTTGGLNFIGEQPLGITLFDIRELDENTIPLKYNPRKAAELEAVISGQAVPIVTRGMFLYSGLTGVVNAGVAVYGGTSGSLTLFSGQGGPQVGITLGSTGVDGSALIKLGIW